jgi:sugar phosphate isomerase/epimerase
MKLTGIADEAGNRVEAQIRAHQELGWDMIESRNLEVEGYAKGSFHEIPEAAFELAMEKLEEAGIGICGVGSTIANWAHGVGDDFQITLDEIGRCIPRMRRCGAKVVRVMSYAILRDEAGRDLEDQQAAERFRRLREIVARFTDAGITVVHENCMNYGGMSIERALETLEAVPGLKWVFDTGNPVFNEDRARPGQRQDAWEFYQAVKGEIEHVHIKDGVWNVAKGDCDYTLPGEGDGQVERIVRDLGASGYGGWISIEPHTAVVFHDVGGGDARDPEELAREQYAAYVEYGRAMEALVGRLRGN